MLCHVLFNLLSNTSGHEALLMEAKSTLRESFTSIGTLNKTLN